MADAAREFPALLTAADVAARCEVSLDDEVRAVVTRAFDDYSW